MNIRTIKNYEERRILNEGGERRGGRNPGKPGKRPGPPPSITPRRPHKSEKMDEQKRKKF